MSSHASERDSEPTMIDRFAALQCDRHRYTRGTEPNDPPNRCVKCGWLLKWAMSDARGGMPYPDWADTLSYAEWLQSWDLVQR